MSPAPAKTIPYTLPVPIGQKWQVMMTGLMDQTDRKAMGARVKTLRKSKHWAQKELAAALGIRFEQVNKYEGGINSPPIDVLVKLADALDTTADYLLTGTRIEDSQLANIRLFRRFQALERLGEEDQQTVMRVIDAMIAQRRVATALTPVDEAPAPAGAQV